MLQHSKSVLSRAPLFSAIKRTIVFLATAWWWASSCHLERCQQYAPLTTLPADVRFTKAWHWMRWKWKQKLSRGREISVHLWHCLVAQQWKVGRTQETQECPDLPGKGAGSMALWMWIIREKSRLWAAAGSSAWGDLWAAVSRNTVRSLLNCGAVLGEAYSLPLPQRGHTGQVLGFSDVSSWFIYLMRNNERDDPQESLEIPLTLQIEHIDKLVIILKWTRESERKIACRKGLFNAQRFLSVGNISSVSEYSKKTRG